MRFLLIYTLVLSCSCYPHRGQPYATSQTQWHQLAQDACVRGDWRAWQTLVTRAKAAGEKEVLDRPAIEPRDCMTWYLEDER